MRKTTRLLLPVLGLWILSHAEVAKAQKLHRIAALIADHQFSPSFEGFRQKMAELGYFEGRNVRYEVHNARGDRDALESLAQQLVQKRPDLIVTSSTTATAPVARATAGANIPVVFLSAGNPLAFVRSYASSGNNLTGITTASIDLTEKRMELLKELAPWVKRVITLHNPEGVSYEANLNKTREAANRLGLQLVEVKVTGPEVLLERAGEIFSRRVGDGVIYPPDASINSAMKKLYPQVTKAKLPAIAVNIGNVRAGALATYAPDYFLLGEQGAILADKILKGARPADLPVEQPQRLRLAINVKTAKAIGLKIPREILLRADDLIE